MSVAEQAPHRVDHIEASPGVCGGKPRIRGTRVKVSSIVARHVYDGQSLDEIVEAFPQLTLAQVHTALAYYYDHRDDLEAELREEDDLIVLLARRYAPQLVSE